MFGRKRSFPPGTFIPTASRVMVICHLSLACSLAAWIFLQPFTGHLFRQRQDLLLYQTVLGRDELLARVPPAQLEEAAQRIKLGKEQFALLPIEEQHTLEEQYRQLQHSSSLPVSNKVFIAAELLCRKLPLYLRGWLLLSVIVSILLLIRTEGSQAVTWILPLIAVTFAMHNLRTAPEPPLAPDAHLFPTEAQLLDEVLDEQLANSIWEQHAQLKRGWETYLLATWGPTLAEAEYHFTLARLQARSNTPAPFPPFHQRLGILALASFFIWNFFFALFMNRRGALHSR